MKWADTRHGLAALFGIAIIESSVFPIPPDVLLIAIVAANTKRWLPAALLCSAGSVVGAMIGYYIGSALMPVLGDPIIAFYHAEGAWQTVVDKYNSDVGLLFLLGAAFTPLPFKVATIAAGATGIAFWPFVGVSMVGRALRFFLVALLLRVYGAPIRAAIEKHFDTFAIAFLVLLIAGFAAIKLL
ncbi:MAG: DedA family protein [Acidobacteria bacterium]|nr:DedA family protein [Acidobacteriota bacterium]